MPEDVPGEARPDPSVRALLDLRDSVKWMIAAAAGVAAVLVAGAQLKDLEVLSDADPARSGVAAVAGVVAFLCVLAVVRGAARVLTAPRPTTDELSKREVRAGGLTYRPRISKLPDKLIQHLLERRTYLLDADDSISAFYSRYTKLVERIDSLLASSDDAQRLRSELVSIEARMMRLEDAAQLFEANRRFRSLVRGLGWGGLVFATAMVAFTWATTERPSARVERPTAVVVYVDDPTVAGLPADCLAKELAGVAVGGDFTQPTVITEPTVNCPSVTIHDGAGVRVLPRVASSSTP